MDDKNWNKVESKLELMDNMQISVVEVEDGYGKKTMFAECLTCGALAPNSKCDLCHTAQHASCLVSVYLPDLMNHVHRHAEGEQPVDNANVCPRCRDAVADQGGQDG